MLPRFSATRAALVQICVLAVAAIGGVALPGEPLSGRLAITSIFILGGAVLVSAVRRSER